MENYTKGKVVEEPLERNKIPFNNIPENFLWMQVNAGSKIKLLIQHAMGILSDDKNKCVLWTGSGPALPRAISCAEILKRKCKIPHQITKIAYRKCEEFWEPNTEGLERLVVNREIPIVYIMLSFDQVDTKDLGYQPLHCKKAFWQTGNTDKTGQYKNKRAPKISPEEIAKMGLQSGSKKNVNAKQKKLNPTR